MYRLYNLTSSIMYISWHRRAVDQEAFKGHFDTKHIFQFGQPRWRSKGLL